jgi:hypothetical protein
MLTGAPLPSFVVQFAAKVPAQWLMFPFRSPGFRLQQVCYRQRLMSIVYGRVVLEIEGAFEIRLKLDFEQTVGGWGLLRLQQVEGDIIDRHAAHSFAFASAMMRVAVDDQVGTVAIHNFGQT